jgi:DNA-binding NarL/FixJ family response regulator
MTTNFLNYLLLAVGILTILAVAIIIFLDKLKGEDIYFNIDAKEQELKKVIDDAEEILSELNFTSDVIVKDIEEKINNLNRIYKSVSNNLEQHKFNALAVTEPTLSEVAEQPVNQIIYERPAAPNKAKLMTISPKKADTPIDVVQGSKQEAIYELVNQGLSIVDIAKKMNIGQGEVALILSLKKEEK